MRMSIAFVSLCAALPRRAPGLSWRRGTGGGCDDIAFALQAGGLCAHREPRPGREAFYRDVLGLRFVADDGFAAVFDLDGAPLRITEIPDHEPGPHPVLGWMVDDIEATVRELADRGVVFTVYEGMGQDALGIWTAPDGSAKVAFFADPDGNGLSLTQVVTGAEPH